MIRIGRTQIEIIRVMAEIGPVNIAGLLERTGRTRNSLAGALRKGGESGVFEELAGAPGTYRLGREALARIEDGRITLAAGRA